MSWPCRLLPGRPEHPQPGDMWYDPSMIAETPLGEICRRHFLSPHYLRSNMTGRPPLMLCLPGRKLWCVDRIDPDGHHWIISGQPPSITVQPTINVPGLYRGTLIDGELSDDQEGRTYDETGRLAPGAVRKVTSL